MCDLQGVLNTAKHPPVFELTDPVIHYTSKNERKRNFFFGRTHRLEGKGRPVGETTSSFRSILQQTTPIKKHASNIHTFFQVDVGRGSIAKTQLLGHINGVYLFFHARQENKVDKVSTGRTGAMDCASYSNFGCGNGATTSMSRGAEENWPT